MKTLTASGAVATIAVVSGALSLSATADAQQQPVPDTYLAVTTNMTPAEVELKADVLRWSSDDERAAVIAALESGDDPAAALRDLPTVGVVWRSGSAVGHSIKYAYRADTADGGERITLVTDKRIGSTSFVPWEADDPAGDAPLDYSVIEMTVGAGAEGQGSMSLAAPITIDTESSMVSLDFAGGTPVLTHVRKAPKPYWATE